MPTRTLDRLLPSQSAGVADDVDRFANDVQRYKPTNHELCTTY